MSFVVTSDANEILYKDGSSGPQVALRHGGLLLYPILGCDIAARITRPLPPFSGKDKP